MRVGWAIPQEKVPMVEITEGQLALSLHTHMKGRGPFILGQERDLDCSVIGGELGEQDWSRTLTSGRYRELQPGWLGN